MRRQNDAPFSMPSPWPDATEVYAPLGRVALATAVVLVLLVIFLVLMRRVWTNRTLAGHANVSWQILGELALGSRNRLLLVQIGREQVLVAVDNRGISGLVLLPMRFADWLDESVDATAENNSRPGRKAAIAAMVGEGDQ
jgi:flagellar biogenesis protein FliO